MDIHATCRYYQATVLTCFVMEVPNLQGSIMATRHLERDTSIIEV